MPAPTPSLDDLRQRGLWGPEAIDAILAELPTGAVTVGGSRCHTTYGRGPDGFYVEHFDEGHVEVQPLAEPALRDVVRSHPDEFLPVLRRPHVRAFRAAFLAGDHPGARAALRAAAVYGDPFDHFAIWDAALAPDGSPVPAPVLAAIADDLRGHTAWHAFWDLFAWDRTPANAAHGVWFLDRLMALAGLDPTGLAQRERLAALAAGAG